MSDLLRTKLRNRWTVHLCEPLDDKGTRRSETLCGLYTSRLNPRWIDVEGLDGGLALCTRCARSSRAGGAS